MPIYEMLTLLPSIFGESIFGERTFRLFEDWKQLLSG